MGAEEFQVTLLSRLPKQRAVNRICDNASIRQLHVGDPLYGEELPYYYGERFVYEDDFHIIELELSVGNELTRISIRFALCQFDSVDAVYHQLVVQLAEELGASITINDEVLSGDPWEFSPSCFNQVADILDRAIHTKRALWIADFGDERTKATCADAVTRMA